MQNSIEVSFDNLPLIVAEIRKQIYVILDFISEKKKEEKKTLQIMPSTQNWLSVKQVAKIIDRSQFTVYTMCNNDEIPFTRYRGSLQFDTITIEEWLKKQYQDSSNLDIKSSIKNWKSRKQKGGNHGK